MAMEHIEEFANELRELAKKFDLTELDVHVAWGNNPVHTILYRPEVKEVFNVMEGRL